MAESFYRTGQAGAILGASSHVLRRLCEAGLIEAEHTGKQWRIPAAELERLKRDGMPPLPSPEDANPTGRKNGSRAKAELLAPPSQDAADSAEDALISENKLKAKTAKVARLKLHKEATEIGDFFRDRRRREDEEEAARERQEREEREEQQRRIAAEQDAQKRREWQDEWIDYAQRSKPFDAPATVALEITAQAESVLQTLDQSRDYTVTRRLVDAAVQRALQPWNESQEKRKAIESALKYEAVSYDPAWSSRAREAVQDALDKLRDGASPSQMKATASEALKPVIRDYKIVSELWLKLKNETSEERQDAQDAVRQALAELPSSASDRQIELACETALRPIKERIAARLDDQMRQEIVSSLNRALPWGISDKLKQAAAGELQDAIDALPHGTPRAELEQLRDRTAQRYRKIHELIDDGLREIFRYLQKVEQKYELPKSVWSLDDELKEPIRKALWQELDGKETPEEVASKVRHLVREELDL